MSSRGVLQGGIRSSERGGALGLRRATAIFAVSMHRFDEVVLVVSYMEEVFSRMVARVSGMRIAIVCDWLCVRLALSAPE